MSEDAQFWAERAAEIAGIGHEDGAIVPFALVSIALSLAALSSPETAGVLDALQAVWDLGDELDSNHARWAALTVAERLGVTLDAHNRISDPPRNRNEEMLAAKQAELDECRDAAGVLDEAALERLRAIEAASREYLAHDGSGLGLDADNPWRGDYDGPVNFANLRALRAALGRSGSGGGRG